MKVGVIPHKGEIANEIVIGTGEIWLNFSGLYHAFNVIQSKTPGKPISSLLDLLNSGQFNLPFFRAVLDWAVEHTLTENFQIDEPKQFGLPLRPGKIICIGRNYAKHAAETGHDVPAEPIFFNKAPSTCIGDGENIVAKSEFGRIDHEGELGVLIGRRGKDVPVEGAREMVAGYTLVNDITARAMQKQDVEAGHPWFRSKSMDTFCPLGPVITLPDAVPWPVEVDIEVRVNGAVRQSSNTRHFIYDIPKLIAYVTRFISLEPGDVIATGTPEGISQLHSGDEVTVSIPEIGTLRNRFVAT